MNEFGPQIFSLVWMTQLSDKVTKVYKNEKTITCNAFQLRLFFAKKNDITWLHLSAVEALTLGDAQTTLNLWTCFCGSRALATLERTINIFGSSEHLSKTDTENPCKGIISATGFVVRSTFHTERENSKFREHV